MYGSLLQSCNEKTDALILIKCVMSTDFTSLYWLVESNNIKLNLFKRNIIAFNQPNTVIYLTPLNKADTAIPRVECARTPVGKALPACP